MNLDMRFIAEQKALFDAEMVKDGFLEMGEKSKFLILDHIKTADVSADTGAEQAYTFFDALASTKLVGFPGIDLSNGVPADVCLGIIGFGVAVEHQEYESDGDKTREVVTELSRSMVALNIGGATVSAARGRLCTIGDVGYLSGSDEGTTKYSRSSLGQNGQLFMLPNVEIAKPNRQIREKVWLNGASWATTSDIPMGGVLAVFYASKNPLNVG